MSSQIFQFNSYLILCFEVSQKPSPSEKSEFKTKTKSHTRANTPEVKRVDILPPHTTIGSVSHRPNSKVHTFFTEHISDYVSHPSHDFSVRNIIIILFIFTIINNTSCK